MMFRTTTARACAVLLMFGAFSASSPADAARAKRKSPPPAAKVEAKPAPKPAPEPTTPATTTRSTTDGEEPGARRGPARIEFDDRLVQGQTNKANAIYLFERRESSMRSLLKKRINFHNEIDEMLEDELVR